MNVPDGLYAELCTCLQALHDESLNPDLIVDLKRLAPRILALRTNQPTDRDRDDRQPRDLQPDGLSFNPTNPGSLTRVGPLPDEEPGYGSTRPTHRHLPDHLSACPAQLGGACTCPTNAKS